MQHRGKVSHNIDIPDQPLPINLSDIDESHDSYIKLLGEIDLYTSLVNLIHNVDDPHILDICKILISNDMKVEPNILKEITMIFLLKGYVYIVKQIEEIYLIIDNKFKKDICDIIINKKINTSFLIYSFFYLFDLGISPYYFTKNPNTIPISKRNIALFHTYWIMNKQ